MSTYVMTDIHGHYDAMMSMLEKIGFSEDCLEGGARDDPGRAYPDHGKV